MDTVFDPEQQQGDVDARLIAALERLQRAFQRSLLHAAAASGLSPIQAQILVFARYHPPALRRVSALSREFSLTPATISDAVRALVRKGLLERRDLPSDRRGHTLALTRRGKKVAEGLAGWAEALRGAVAPLDREAKGQALYLLLEMIVALQRAGLVDVARTCLTCRYFQPGAHPGSGAPHHCRLLDRPLAGADLRVDCPDHCPAAPAAG